MTLDRARELICQEAALVRENIKRVLLSKGNVNILL